jgi:hypothetical protein
VGGPSLSWARDTSGEGEGARPWTVIGEEIDAWVQTPRKKMGEEADTWAPQI